MKNSTVLIVRHGEKTGLVTDLELNPQGHARASAFVGYFDHLKLDDKPIKISHIFAAKDSHKSIRPRQTITPLATHLNKTIHQQKNDESIEHFAKEMLAQTKYDNETLVVCWRHEEIFELAKALGLDSTQLPATANWPTKWPENAFGWLIVIKFNEQGEVDHNASYATLQNLMYTDYGVGIV